MFQFDIDMFIVCFNFICLLFVSVLYVYCLFQFYMFILLFFLLTKWCTIFFLQITFISLYVIFLYILIYPFNEGHLLRGGQISYLPGGGVLYWGANVSPLPKGEANVRVTRCPGVNVLHSPQRSFLPPIARHILVNLRNGVNATVACNV